MKRFSFVVFGFILSLFSFTQLASALPAAVPTITEVRVGSAVNVGKYIVVPHTAWGADGSSAIFIMPGQTMGNSTSAAPDFRPAAPITYTSSEVPMSGVAGGYGALLAQFDATTLPALASPPYATNTNPLIFGSASGPAITQTALSLLGVGIADGTTVTFTVNMKGLVPQLVAIMGNHPNPTVEYNPGGFAFDGSLTVTTATFTNVNAASESFNSTVGFMVSTDTMIAPDPTNPASPPLGIIAQTNHWVGDMFPLLPGFDSNAAVPGNGGSRGAATARCGTTFYGPVGQMRDIKLFIPDPSLPALFGTNVTKADLSVYVENPSLLSENPAGAVINTSAANFGPSLAMATPGIRVDVPYTFASPKDIAFGISSSKSALVANNAAEGTTDAQGGCLSPVPTSNHLLPLGIMLLAGLASLALLRWRKIKL